MLVGLLFCAAFVVISFFAQRTARKYLRSEKGGQVGSHRGRSGACSLIVQEKGRPT